MEAEFLRALMVVLAVGSVIAGVGTLLLYFAFRAFSGAGAGRTSHMVLIASVVVFVFGCCLLLFMTSGR